MITIRSETPQDIPAIRLVNESAFGRQNEAALVDALRTNGAATISLVAVVDERVVGHILFSPISIEPESSVSNGLGLAPMAVLPEFQNQGIGSQMVRAGLKECERLGYEAVVVLGHPEFYPRFGFIHSSQKGLRSEYPVPDEAFMVIELKPNALDGQPGLVKYRAEFGAV